MASIFKKSTDRIKSIIIKEIEMVTDSFTHFIEILEGTTKELDLHKIRENENEVNYLVKKINEDVYFELTKGPASKDLRRLLSYLFISKDIERVGDSAIKVSRFLDDFSDKITDKKVYINSFVEIIAIYRGIVDFIDSEDASKITTEYTRKLETSKLYSDVFKNILGYADDSTNSEYLSSILVVLKAVERAGDYYRNVLEQIFYIATGSDLEQQ